MPQTVRECFDLCQPHCNPDMSAPSCVLEQRSQCQAHFGNQKEMTWNGGQDNPCQCYCETWSYPSLFTKVVFEGNDRFEDKGETIGCEPRPHQPVMRKVAVETEWPNMLSITGGVLQECTGSQTCWKVSRNGGFFITQRNGQGQSRPQKMVLKLYVACNLNVVNCDQNANTVVKFNMGSKRGGRFKLTWDGVKVSQERGFRIVSGQQGWRPGTQFEAELPAARGHELQLEFMPTRDNYEIYVRDVEFYVPFEMAECVSRQGHSDHLPILHEAATLSGNMSSDTQSSCDSGLDYCICPPLEDPILWDCDCYDQWMGECGDIDSVDAKTCLQGIWCSSDQVCQSWKLKHCGSFFLQQRTKQGGQEHTAALAKRSLIQKRAFEQSMDTAATAKYCR